MYRKSLLFLGSLSLSAFVFTACGGGDDKSSGSNASGKDELIHAALLDEADTMIRLDMNAFWNSPIVGSIRSSVDQMSGNAAGGDGESEATELETALGIRFSDVETVLGSVNIGEIAAAGEDEQAQMDAAKFVLGFKITEPVDEAKLEAFLKEENTTDSEIVKKSMGDATVFYQEPLPEDEPPGAIALLNTDSGSHIFFGTQAEVEGAVKSGAKAVPEQFADVSGLAPADSSFVMMMDTPSNWSDIVDQMAADNPNASPEDLKFAKTMEQMAVSLSTTDVLGFQAKVISNDAEEAQKAYEKIQTGLDEIKTGPQNPMMPVGTFLKSVNTSVDGEAVTLAGSFTEEQLQQAQQVVMMMVMGMMMQQQGGGMGPQPGMGAPPSGMPQQ